VTLTPLHGLSEVVRSFMPDGNLDNSAKFVVSCTWDEAPHLPHEIKDQLRGALPPHERDARSKGIPYPRRPHAAVPKVLSGVGPRSPGSGGD
jgi:hypothetical protein